MTGRLGMRLVRLEGRLGGGWRRWVGTPHTEWPDAALISFICEGLGLPLPPSDAAAATWLTDAQLTAIAAGASDVAGLA